MSSIIDALKKSDANRPRKNHGMKMKLNLSHPAVRKRRFMIPLVVLLVVAMAAVSWYLKKPNFIWQAADSSTTVQVSAIKPAKTPAKTPAKLAKPEPGQVQNKAQESLQKDNLTQEGDKNSATNPSAKISEDSPPLAATSDTTAQERTEVTDLDDDSNQPVTNTPNAAERPLESKVVTETQAIDAQLSETPMKNKQVINKPLADTDANTANAVPQLFELPYAIRKDLPKLTLSVHIYDPIVENRMAILNGLSVHVGDTFEELLTIKNITQEGIVLSTQNRDFIILK